MDMGGSASPVPLSAHLLSLLHERAGGLVRELRHALRIADGIAHEHLDEDAERDLVDVRRGSGHGGLLASSPPSITQKGPECASRPAEGRLANAPTGLRTVATSP